MKLRKDVIREITAGAKSTKYPVALTKNEQAILNSIVSAGMHSEFLNSLNNNLGASIFETIFNSFGDEALFKLMDIPLIMYTGLSEENGTYSLYQYIADEKWANRYLLCLESEKGYSLKKETTSILHATFLATLDKMSLEQSVTCSTLNTDISDFTEILLKRTSEAGIRTLAFIRPKSSRLAFC